MTSERPLDTGRELVELHHLTKGLAPYGSVFIPAGAGSIVRLSGRASGTTGTLTHRKSPAHVVGPLKVVHDRDHGEVSLRQSDASAGKSGVAVEKDLVGWVTGRGRDGITAVDAAMFLYSSGERGDVERARRVLDTHIGRGLMSGIEGTRGGNAASRKPSRWVAVETGCRSVTRPPG